jgi:hypothetical protein
MIVGCLTAACGSPSSPKTIDLVAALSTAERRALHDPDAAIRSEFLQVGANRLPAIVTEAPARIIFPVRMPAPARFLARVALQPESSGATVRVGIADDRSYDELVRLALAHQPNGATAWQSVDVDLAAYSGWRWSLFYHPARRTWKLVLNADATPGGTVVWLQPTIDMRR